MNLSKSYKTIFILSIALPLLFSISVFGPRAQADQVDDLQQAIEEKEAEIEKLRKEADLFKENIKTRQEFAGSLEEQIGAFNADINQLHLQIDLTQREIDAAELTIEKLGLEIEEKEASVDKRRRELIALLREIYRREEDSMIVLLLKNDELSNFFNQVQARKTLQESIGTQLFELKAFRVQLEETQLQIADQRDELKEDRFILADQQGIIVNERARKNNLLLNTREQEAEYQELLQDAETLEQQVRREIFELEEDLRRALDPNSLPDESLTFTWPTEGLLTQTYGCIHTIFGRRTYPSCDGGAGGWHNGLDIAAGLGTPLRAVASGTVVGLGNAPYAYGLWIAVEQTNGLVSIYGHTSRQVVSVGQAVKRGEIVGYMGSTGFSTGSHLHFTMFAPDTYQKIPSKLSGTLPIGATISPLNYLP